MALELSQKEQDIQLMLAAQCHLGTKNCDFQMERYVYKRRNDGIYIINMGKTWDKLQVAARVIVAIENPQDIVVQSARPYGARAILKFAQYTGAKVLSGRHTPGEFRCSYPRLTSAPPFPLCLFGWQMLGKVSLIHTTLPCLQERSPTRSKSCTRSRGCLCSRTRARTTSPSASRHTSTSRPSRSATRTRLCRMLTSPSRRTTRASTPSACCTGYSRGWFSRYACIQCGSSAKGLHLVPNAMIISTAIVQVFSSFATLYK